MKFFAVVAFTLVILTSGIARAADVYRQVLDVKPLPTRLDRDFEFRKAKLFLLSDIVVTKQKGKLSPTGGVIRDPSIGFERTYRLYGAVTGLDQRRRYGNYFDFFWRAKRQGPITIRLEYRQEKLREATQAREVDYPNAKGNHKTEFAIIGDDFFNDGRVLAWRCLLLEKGQIVAEDRSFLWR